MPARGYVIVPMGNFAAAIYDDRAAIDAAIKAQPWRVGLEMRQP